MGSGRHIFTAVGTNDEPAPDYVFTADDRVIEGEVEDGKRYIESGFNRAS